MVDSCVSTFDIDLFDGFKKTPVVQTDDWRTRDDRDMPLALLTQASRAKKWRDCTTAWNDTNLGLAKCMYMYTTIN